MSRICWAVDKETRRRYLAVLGRVKVEVGV